MRDKIWNGKKYIGRSIAKMKVNKMKCTHCNTKLTTNAQSCPNCGQPIAATEKTKKRLSLKTISLLSLVIILTASIVVLYQWGLYMTSPQKLMIDFKQALEDHDAEQVVNFIDSKEEQWSFKEEDAERLLAFLEQYPNVKEDLLKQLDEQAVVLTENKQDVEATDQTFAYITIGEKGRKWIFFQEYGLFLRPAMIHVNVNQDAAALHINEELVEEQTKKNDRHTFGPFSIGIYNIKAVLPGKYIDAEENVEVILYGLHEPAEEVELSIHASRVEAYTAFEETSLLLNGEKTDIHIGTTPEELGLVPLDGSVKFSLEKEFPWGTAKSEEFVVDQRRMDLRDFSALSKEQKEEIIEMLNENWLQHTEALQSGNTDHMQLVPDHYKKKVEKQASNLIGKRKEYIATFKQARYDMNTFNIPVYNSEESRYELKVEAEYTLEEPELHGYALLRSGNDATTTYYLTVYYDEVENEWKLDDYATGSFFLRNSSDIRTYNING